MKHCYHRGRFTGGKDPLFCQNCGRSYDVRLCPRHHANPRSAEFCSQCGSPKLSVPQPKVFFGWKVVEFLILIRRLRVLQKYPDDPLRESRKCSTGWSTEAKFHPTMDLISPISSR